MPKRAFKSLIAALVLLPAAAFAQGPPRAREVDYLPPEWTGPPIVWRDTWEQTLAANPLGEPVKAGRDKAAAAVASRTQALRKITLLKAMIARFKSPADREKHADAYRQIADAYAQAGSMWWRSYYLYALIKEFPQRKDLAAAAYADIIDQPFQDAVKNPSAMDWAFVMQEILDLNEAGAIPNTDPVVLAALQRMAAALAAQPRYDAFAAFFKAVARVGPQCPRAYAAAGDLLTAMGHGEQAAAYYDKSQDASKGMGRALPGPAIRVPRNVDMEMRWEAAIHIREAEDAAAKADELARVADLGGQSGLLLRVSDTHYISYRAAADQALCHLPPQALTALRTAQEQAARNLAQQLRQGGDPHDLANLARKYPWAASVHEALLDFGEHSLRGGRRQGAFAAFGDVLRHAGDADLRLCAQVGLWLALAQENAPRWQIDAAMAAVPDSTLLPWRGGRSPAAKIKEAILSAAAGASERPIALASLVRRRIELPPLWAAPSGAGAPRDVGPVDAIQVDGDAMFVSGAKLARFAAAGGKSLWVHAPPQEATNAAKVPAQGVTFVEASRWWRQNLPRPIAVRGPASSALGDVAAALGTLRAFYTLVDGAKPQIEACDVRGGAALWTTAESSEWKNLTPLSEPTVAEGRLYALAVQGGEDSSALTLVCLDGRSGHLLWKQGIGSWDRGDFESARGACCVSVHQGSVYCATNLGIVARCDARDGTVEWLSGYAGSAGQSSREGAGAIVAGETVLVAPRDHSGVLALHRDSGKLLWEALLVPSDRLVGVSGGTLVCVNGQWLAGLDVATGRVQWCRSFEQGTGSQAAVVAGEVILVSGAVAHRLQAQTGKTLEQRDLNLGSLWQHAILPDGSLAEVAGPTLAAGRSVSLAEGADIFAAPADIKEVWSLPCQNPILVTPPQDRDAGALGVLVGRQAASLQLRGQVKIAWQQFLPAQAAGGSIVGGRMVLRSGHDLTALDLADGTLRWSVKLPFCPYQIDGDDSFVAAATCPWRLGNSWEPYAAAVDGGTGKVLWSRPFSDPMRFRPRQGLLGMRFERGADARAQLHLFLTAAFGGDGGAWQVADVAVDATSGGVRQISPLLDDLVNWPDCSAFGPAGVCYINGALRAKYRPAVGDPGVTGAWRRGADPRITEIYPWCMGVRSKADGAYLRFYGQLFRFDPATRKEIIYNLPPGPEQTLQGIYDFRVVGSKMVVVSGLKGKYLHRRERQDIDVKWARIEPRMHVDVFDAVTAVHLSRRELTGAACSQSYRQDCDAQAVILDNAVVVADSAGVHVYGCPRP
ncbi:MAG: PQQ-binding-like beta-propeller repeat protein [Planctomycetaceae bacterium]|nr:PQQ-binding-like beta-propeller repeat protein [Planctomycetaceae bacterium]